MISFGIVGSGYRAEYYGRIARTYPEIFRAVYLCRSQEKVERMTAHTGMPATMSREAFLDFGPDFLVIAVDVILFANMMNMITLHSKSAVYNILMAGICAAGVCLLAADGFARKGGDGK